MGLILCNSLYRLTLVVYFSIYYLIILNVYCDGLVAQIVRWEGGMLSVG